MPPLCRDIQCSAHLQLKLKIIMLPSGSGSGYPQYSFVPQSNPQMATPKPKMRTTVGPPVESHSHPSPAGSQAKHTRKCHQEPQEGSGSEAIHWEPYPQLMRDLLAWILQHLVDRAVLFNKMMDQNVQDKPHSQRKDINAVIANAIFREDRQYGEAYASQPARFKSTGEGINPNNPNYQNLHEQVLTEFPFWEECDQLWHGNPTYDARVFNVTPGADQTVGYPTSSTNANWDPDPNISMDVPEQEEEEEGETDEGWEGDWNMVSVLESAPEYCGNCCDFMLVDE
ncbi:hypothetical protein EDC04DRAFT_2616894 [Pisolithus marmoratus]|nr:hypothetical protein EDC04DRAFT_2616894 [Pisolithus marmoratus]